MQAILTIDGMSYPLTVIERQKSKPFSSGSVGYYLTGKVQIGDKKHQLGANVVEVGSKPKK